MPQETAYSAQPIPAETISGITPQEPLKRAPANPENPPWGIPSALGTWFMSIALLFLVPNLCVLPYLAYHYRGVPVTTREVLLADKTFVFLFVCGWVPAHLLTLMLVWAVATRMGKFSLKEMLGWSWSPDFGIWKSIGLAIVLFVVTMFLVGLFGSPRTDLDRILESSRAAALALAFLAVATAPLVEEIIYRGLLYSALQRVIGRWFAVGVVAAMFAGLHVVQYWPNVGAISSITLLSVVLTVIRARTGRLLPCFVIHLVFNGVQSLIIVFEPYLQALFNFWRSKAASGVLVCVWRCLG
jgi:membrane protease YdiL (CAAX protease family)